MRRPGLLLTAIGCLAATATPAATLQLDVAAAWGGWSRPGRITETELRLRSSSRTNAEVTLTAGGQVIQSTVHLEPGEPARLSVPVQATERLTVQVAATAMSPQQAEIGLSLSEAPLLAWAGPALSAQPVAGFHAVEFDAGALPRNAAAYSSIDALVIDHTVIDALAEDQLAALLSFMAGCGRTVLISDASGAAALLQGAVGCGGRQFAVAVSAEDARASLGRILDSAQDPLPRAVTLAGLGEHELDVWYLVVAVLAVCLAAMALAAIFSVSLATAVLVPAVAAAASLAFVQSRPASTRLTVWAETRSNDRLAQYRGLQRITSPRRGVVDVPVMAVLAEPQACNAADHSTWSWDAERHRFTSARVAGRLFATASLCYSGAFPVTRAAVSRGDATGRVALRNAGPAAWPAGTLVWDRRLQSMPALAAGGELLLRAEQGTPPASAAARQAIARTPIDGMAILWPLDLQVVDPAPTAAQAWLLLQVGHPT